MIAFTAFHSQFFTISRILTKPLNDSGKTTTATAIYNVVDKT